ncbi:MAG: PAS domain S-box protein, partial [Chloroflexi bacterium]|nr:PAS domain S-box protein [Chloroflexota bacterium]
MSLDNEIYHALAEQTADHILVTDPEGIILYVNPAFETLTGYSQKEVLGKTPRILKSGEHERDFYTKLWDTVLSGQTFRGMSINKKKDGSLYYEEKTITPVKDVDGQITHLISTGKDVTERVEAERSLAKSEEYNRHILGNVLDGVVSMNENGRIIGWNKEAEQIFGWSAKDIIGRLMTETIIPKQHRRNHTKGLKHYNKTGEGPILNRRVEITGLHAKGHEFPIELAVTPSKQDDQNIFHAFVQDISQRKKAENKIQQYQEALKEKADSLATINALADSLHRALDYQAVITRATEAIVKFTQAPSLAFYSLDESGERMQLLASHGFSKDAVQIGATLPIKGTLSGITLTQRQVVTSEDIEADERIEPALRQAMLAQKLNHVISLPLLFQEQALGVINLVYADAQLFNEQDIETLLTIGKTIGLALVNAQRMNDIQLNEAQARLHLKTSQALAASQTPDEVIDIIVEKSAYYPQVAISLFLLENMGETAVLKLRKVNMAESGLPQLPASTQIPSGDLPQIFSSDQSFIIEDILASKQTSQVQEFVSQSGAVSLVTLPLTSGGEWLGTLVAISPEKAFFREEHLTVYHDIVEQGALALRAEKLNEEARTTLVRREREVTLATQVAQEIAEATNLHDLYQRVVTQVQEQF